MRYHKAGQPWAPRELLSMRDFHYFEGETHMRAWMARAVRRQIVRRVLKWQHSHDPKQRAEAGRLMLRYRGYF